jgi:hypothetical protein
VNVSLIGAIMIGALGVRDDVGDGVGTGDGTGSTIISAVHLAFVKQVYPSGQGSRLHVIRVAQLDIN